MRLQNSILCKWHTTFGTCNWLLYFIILLMGFQTTTLYKSLHILNGQIASLGCVSLNVFQLTTLQKCLITLATRKWLLSYMNPCVTLCIWHVTNRTGKWFSSPVDMFMCLQGMIMYKWFFTVGARKWPLSCTDPVMFLQFIIFFTGLVTFCRGK